MDKRYKLSSSIIRYERKNKAEDQYTVAKAVYISNSYYSKIENGNYKNAEETIDNILKYFDIKLSVECDLLNTIEILFREYYYHLVQYDISTANDIWDKVVDIRKDIDNSIFKYRYYLYEYMYNFSNEIVSDNLTLLEILKQESLVYDYEKNIIDRLIRQVKLDNEENFLENDINDKYTIKILQKCALNNVKDKKYLTALENLYKVFEINKKDNGYIEINRTLMIIGYIAYKLKEHNKAIEYLTKVKETKKDKDYLYALYTKMLCYIELQDDEHFEEIIEVLKNKGLYLDNIIIIETVLRYYVIRNNIDKFNETYNIYLRMKIVDITSKKLISVYKKIIDDNENIIDDLNKCLKMVYTTNHKKMVLKLLSDSYYKLANYQKAYEYYVKYSKIQ